MQKVKEELFLSLIFVGKWLTLGLGALGILYLAVYLAYHKSYFDPYMAKFDFEINEQQEIITGLETTRSALNREIQSNDETSILLKTELSAADERIENAKNAIENLGLKWWEKIPVPMLKKEPRIVAVFRELEIAESERGTIEDKIQTLEEKQEESNKILSATSDKIQEHKITIATIERDKKKAEVDVKGPLLWLVGVLGLT